jgi:hypothetical protein
MVHLQAFQDGANSLPFLCEAKGDILLGVGFGIEVELETELVDEFGIDGTLIKDRRHEQPSIEVQNEVAKKPEDEVHNAGFADEKAGIQGPVKCLLHRITVSKSKSL